jgi:hypothetical protein
MFWRLFVFGLVSSIICGLLGLVTGAVFFALAARALLVLGGLAVIGGLVKLLFGSFF